MIGHLQTNKAARAVELFAAVDSVDSLRLAEKLNAHAQAVGKRIRVLVEVSVGGEAAKSGLRPTSPHLEELLRSAENLRYLEFRGLMTIGAQSTMREVLEAYPGAQRALFRRSMLCNFRRRSTS